MKAIFLRRQNPAITAKVMADKAAVCRARRQRALQAAKAKASSPKHRRHVPSTELAAALRAFQNDFQAMTEDEREDAIEIIHGRVGGWTTDEVWRVFHRQLCDRRRQAQVETVEVYRSFRRPLRLGAGTPDGW